MWYLLTFAVLMSFPVCKLRVPKGTCVQSLNSVYIVWWMFWEKQIVCMCCLSQMVSQQEKCSANAEGKWNESKWNSKKRTALEFSIIFSSSFGESGRYGTCVLELSKGSQVALCTQQTAGRRNFSGQFWLSGYYQCPIFKSDTSFLVTFLWNLVMWVGKYFDSV